MLPAGLAIVGFSDRAMQATKTSTLPRTFFDVHDMQGLRQRRIPTRHPLV
jgi:alanine-glyoxylate transaminase/serine-glyoxylate transaminase/serine-pyruvate transaminase